MNFPLLDEKDKKILYYLDLNPTVSFKKLSRLVGVNRNTLEYRVSRLFDKKILLNYFPVINGLNLGVTYFKYFLKIRRKPAGFSLSLLFREPEIVWVAETEGNWDLTVGFKIHSSGRGLDILDKVNRLFEIEKKLLLVINKAHFFNERWLSDEKEYKESVVEYTKETKAGETDQKILQLLYDNARMRIVEIAQKTNLSPETVGKRIKNLEKSKIILGYKTRINYEALGFEYFHILVSLKEQKAREKVLAFLKNQPNCLTILEFYGSYDIQAEIIAQKYSEVRLLIEQLKEKFVDQLEEINKLYIVQQSNTKTF